MLFINLSFSCDPINFLNFLSQLNQPMSTFNKDTNLVALRFEDNFVKDNLVHF